MTWRQDFHKYRQLYLIALPVIAYYIVFHYAPLYGALIAFKDFSPRKGILGSSWVGLEHFVKFFKSYYFWRVLKNTLLISLYQILYGFPAPIILALLMNEIRNQLFKRSVQTITYLPHFISLVVTCGMIVEFVSTDGVINDLIVFLGGVRSPLLQRPELFRTIFVSSSIWQQVGWGTIIYLAALSGIDPQLYEAAILDGAGRWKQTLHITLPCIMQTIVILLILRIGRIMNVGFQKVILLYNPAIYETADVISSFVYRRGLLEFDYSFSAAVGLFNSLVNFLLIIGTNALSRKIGEHSLW